MRWGWAPIVLSMCAAARVASAQSGDVIAVFAIENAAGLQTRDVEQLTNVVATLVAASRKFRIVPTSDLKKALASQKARSYESCYDQACQIDIGKEVAAAKTLSTSVAQLGKSCVVNMQLYDLRESASEAAASVRGQCSIEGVMDSLEKAVSEVIHGKAAVPAGGAPVAATPAAAAGSASCRAIAAAGGKDGVYTIDPDGSGKGMRVYCNVSGGGWTLLLHNGAGDHGKESTFYDGESGSSASFGFRGERIAVRDLAEVIRRVPFEEIWFEVAGEYRYRASSKDTPFAQKKRLRESWTKNGGGPCDGDFRWAPFHEGSYTTVSGLLGCLTTSGYGDKRVMGIAVQAVDSPTNRSGYRCIEGCGKSFTIGNATHRDGHILGDAVVWIR